MHFIGRNTARNVINRLRYGSVAAASEDDVLRVEEQFYSSYVTAGMTVFDVGANIGDLTEKFSVLVGSGVVHAFEASSSTFDRLQERALNRGWSNVWLNHVALGDKVGVAQLNVYDDEHSGWNTMAERPLAKHGIHVGAPRKEEVQLTTIESYCKSHGIAKIDLLKIDVEGAEYQVLLGARTMLEGRRIGCCAFEFGGTTFDMGNKPDDIQNYLHDMGYSIRNIVAGDPVFPGRQTALMARFSMHLATPMP